MSAKLVEFTIPGSPGLGAVNRANRTTRHGGVYKSPKSKHFASKATLCARAAWSKSGSESPAECSVVIRAYWGRQRHLEGTLELPVGDVDAPVKAVLDAIEAAGIITDDVRVRTVTASKWLDADNPRIEVEVWSVEVRPDHA